jgi:hypothetical protein
MSALAKIDADTYSYGELEIRRGTATGTLGPGWEFNYEGRTFWSMNLKDTIWLIDELHRPRVNP